MDVPGPFPTGRMRLFFALDPRARDRRRLAAAVTRYRASFSQADLRWLDPASWHLTVRFLGETDRGAEVLDRLDGLALPAAPAVEVRALGPFPRRRPVVVAAQLSRHDGVEALAAALEAAARACGFAAERRPFRPHLTVARLNRRSRVRFATRALTLTLGFDRLCLYRSRLSSTGARYSVVRRWSLDSDPS